MDGVDPPGTLNRVVAATPPGEGGRRSHAHDERCAAARVADVEQSEEFLERGGKGELAAEAGDVESWIEAVRGDTRSFEASGEFEGEHEVEQFAFAVHR